MWGEKTAKALCVFLAVSGGSTLSQTPCCGRLWLHPFAEYDEWLRGMEVALSLTAGNPWMRRSVSSASSQPVQQSPSKQKRRSARSLSASLCLSAALSHHAPSCLPGKQQPTDRRTVAEAAAAETSPLPPSSSFSPPLYISRTHWFARSTPTGSLSSFFLFSFLVVSSSSLPPPTG